MATQREPAEVIIRMYNVGFGDCFLLSFRYLAPFPADREYRHMLVDFGSTMKSPGGPTFGQIAKDIEAVTEGNLDVVVATHRHKDHIGGFAGSETDKVMDALTPTKVIRPWTDFPDGPNTATDMPELDQQSKDFLKVLKAQEAWLERLAGLPRTGQGPKRAKLPADLEDQLPNRDAIQRLDDWSDDGRGLYVKAGKKLNLKTVLPGVTIRVLGPPTIRQVPRLATEAAEHKEYWLRPVPTVPPPLGGNRRLTAAYTQLAGAEGIGEARWILDRLHQDDANVLFRVARAFDETLNNTSVIMRVEAGNRSMLLSGDAQIENWEHCLNQINAGGPDGKGLETALREIDLYKVGHHGSRNATPITLHDLWRDKRKSKSKFVTLLSTDPHKHPGKSNPVPKDNLVTALKEISTLHRTDKMPKDELCLRLSASTKGTQGFVRESG